MNLFLASSFTHPLEPVTLDGLHRLLTDPASELAGRIRSLRNTRNLDDTHYQRSKSRLPWFIGALFRNGQRNSNDFASIHWMIIDLDHLFTSEEAIAEAKNRLQTDPRVALAYVSPSGEGLKVLFQMEEGITHTKAFAEGYQRFAREWARHYGWEDKVDYKTHDVTRVSFLSFDPAPVYHPEPEPLPVSLFGLIQLPWEEQPGLLKPAAPAVTDSETPDAGERETAAPAAGNSGSAPMEVAPPANSLSDEVMRTIQVRLSPGHRPVKAPQPAPHVPEVLRGVGRQIQTLGADVGIKVVLTDIQYGLRVRGEVGLAWAELNLFHGRQGFSMVPTPKKGSHGELALLLAELVGQVLTAAIPDMDPLRRRMLESGLSAN